MRILLGVIGLLLVAACAPRVPDSGAPANAAGNRVETGAIPGDTQPAVPETDLGATGEPASPGAASGAGPQAFLAPDLHETADISLAVEYAVATSNAVGEQLYRRSKLRGDRFLKNCSKYSSTDLAQVAFLERGGPRRDPMGIDPDGDGFACYWDPTPYRLAARAAQADSAPDGASSQ